MNKAETIHKNIFTVDSHTDTPFWFSEPEFDFSGKNGNKNFSNKVDLAKMGQGGLDGVFLAVFIGQGARDDSTNKAVMNRAMMIFDSIYSVVGRFPGLARITLTPDEAYINKKEGLRSIFIGIENGYAIGSDLGLIMQYYKRGARYITLCHTKNNDICDSSTDEKGPEHGGLSDFGREVVMEMNRAGMMIDVSHLSDKSFYDVIALTKAPMIASHSDARALCDSPRNLTDDMLVKLDENNGVIQLCLLSAYVVKQEPDLQRDSAHGAWDKKYPDYGALGPEEKKQASKEWDAIDEQFPPKLATVSDLVNHIDHIVKVAGVDHVGIGSDFDGGGGLSNCRDAGQMKNITIELLRRGYTEEEIGKIWGGNLFRVMGEVAALGVSSKQ